MRERTATAVTPCDLSFLARQTVIDLMARYPSLKEKLQQFTKGRIKKELQVMTSPLPWNDHGSTVHLHHDGCT